MINGLTHSGFSVRNLDTALAFFKEVLRIENIKSQVSDQDYLSKVTGFPNASLKIGFAKKEGDAFPLEIIEYVHPRGKPSLSGLNIVGTQHRCYEVVNLDAFFEQLSNLGIRFINKPQPNLKGFWPEARGVLFYGPDETIFELLENPRNRHGDPQVLRIHHLGLTVSSMPDAIQLLCGNLHLKQISNKHLDWEFLNLSDKLSVNQLDAGLLLIPGTDVFLELWQFEKAGGPPALTTHNNFGSGHLCFQVDDIHQDHKILEEAGVKFVGLPAEVTAGVNKGAFAIYFSGFDGFRFELFQKPI